MQPPAGYHHWEEPPPSEDHGFYESQMIPEARPETQKIPSEGVRPVMNNVAVQDIIRHALCDVMVTTRLTRSRLQKLSDEERRVLEGLISSKSVEKLILQGLRYEVESKAAFIIGELMCKLDVTRRRRAILKEKTFEEMFGKRVAKALIKAKFKTPIDLIDLDKSQLLEIPGIGEETVDRILKKMSLLNSRFVKFHEYATRS